MPILGGGIITAFSIPIIMQWGSLPFGIVSAIVTVATTASAALIFEWIEQLTNLSEGASFTEQN